MANIKEEGGEGGQREGGGTTTATEGGAGKEGGDKRRNHTHKRRDNQKKGPGQTEVTLKQNLLEKWRELRSCSARRGTSPTHFSLILTIRLLWTL